MILVALSSVLQGGFFQLFRGHWSFHWIYLGPKVVLSLRDFSPGNKKNFTKAAQTETWWDWKSLRFLIWSNFVGDLTRPKTPKGMVDVPTGHVSFRGGKNPSWLIFVKLSTDFFSPFWRQPFGGRFFRRSTEEENPSQICWWEVE